ncbi:catechol O-methyltransferase A isoform X1 [Bombina bombina]|uniref:catechol O-methyltransferase A isoform X1 n=1 Tax=Bombina bombina TaxID=8345 RepID=UPI00235ABB8B|nr:catechol O-methyltransferase A isoform X1 [Bombina bombina]
MGISFFPSYLQGQRHRSGFQQLKEALSLVAMISLVLTFCAVLGSLLFLVIRRIRTEGAWALWWHDNYLERLRDFLSGTSRPRRILQYVQKVAKRGDADSVLCAVDTYCSQVEWAMNVGDKKGQILDATVLETRPHWVLELGTYCGYSAMRIARLLPPGARLVTIEMNPDYATVAKEIIQHAGLDVKLIPFSSDYPIPTSPTHSSTQRDQSSGEGTIQRKWRLQEALIYTTLHCLQLPLQLFSRTSQTPLSPLTQAQETTAQGQKTNGDQTCKVELLVGSTSELIPQLKTMLDVTSFDLVFIDHWKASYLPDTKLLEECGLLRTGSVLLADNVTCPGAPEFLHYVRNSTQYQSQYFPSQLEYLQVEDGMEKSVFLG